MRKPRSAVLFFVLLVFGLSLAVPAEDVPETAYDESGASPYLSTPLFSNLISQATTLVTGTLRSAAGLRPGTLSRFAIARITGTDRHRSAKARVVRALLCTLLC